MYYNTKMFKEAGIEKAATTWDEFVADAKKLTKDTNGDGKPDQWGFTAAGASVSANSHQAFIRGLQNGGTLFDRTASRPSKQRRPGQGCQAVDRPDGHRQGDVAVGR